MTVTGELCEIIAATRFRSLGARCVRRIEQAIADGIAVAAAGSLLPPLRLLAAHLESLGGKPQATAWGHGFKTSTVHAAYLNGTAMHVLDFEPMALPPTHSLSPTVPVAFALAEAEGLDGREVVTAVAKGLEIQARILLAADQYRPEALRFHPPGTAGVMGAAVTAGHLLGLDAARLVHALGIAASRAGALLANIGSMTKATHCGYAAASGLDAALLAARGFTAHADILAAPRGFVSTFFPEEFDRRKLLAYGQPFRVVEPGLAIKMFPSQFATHWAIAAALELRPRITDPASVEKFVLTTPVMNYCDRPQPEDGLEGKFSFQYAAAAALLDGVVDIDTFTDARRFRPDMAAMLRKMELRQDRRIPGEWRGMRVTIEAGMRDGTKLKAVSHGPRGVWGQPPLTATEHEAKLRDCLGHLLDARRVTRALAKLHALGRQNARGVRALVSLLARHTARRTPRARERARIHPSRSRQLRIRSKSGAKETYS
jgi:aconitate decarboxylase